MTYEPIITEEQAGKALEWLVSNARAIADAKRELVLAERNVDRVKALVMKKHSELPISAQEREAKASDNMNDAYTREAEAAANYEYLRHLRDTAHAKLEAFRTMESTRRMLAK